jgi:hypothetical protein
MLGFRWHIWFLHTNYRIFRRAGVDAARSFGTGCFRDHRTHDLRGLSEAELEVRLSRRSMICFIAVCLSIIIQSVNHWKKFFAEHKTYTKVGRVSHPPIDPASPIPEPCDATKRKAAKEGASTAGPHYKPSRKNDVSHEEL